MAGMLDRIGSALSAATHGASVVLAPKREAPIKHIDFVPLSPDRALVVLVHADGHVENRLFQPPPGHTPSAMREAANYLNAHLAEKTLGSLRDEMQREVEGRRAQIDEIANHLIEAGLAVWDGDGEDAGRLIVRGRAKTLLSEMAAEARGAGCASAMLFETISSASATIAEFPRAGRNGWRACAFSSAPRTSFYSLSGSAWSSLLI